MDDDSPWRQEFTPPPRYPIESVDNALQLLALFLTTDRLRVKDAAELLGVGGGTAHRLLAMLQYRGFVAQDPLTKVYVPGSLLLRVGLRAVQGSDLRQVARPAMEALHEQLDETIQLATLQGTEVFFVDAVEASKTLKVSSRAGTSHPAHCTSVGKAMLAELPRAALLELYPDRKLPAVTPSSITSRAALFKELEATRARGYALNRGELEEGIVSVASCIRDRDGRVIAALGAGAPAARLERRLDKVAALVVETADRISDARRMR